MAGEWHAYEPDIRRDDSKLTPTLEVPPGVFKVQIPKDSTKRSGASGFCTVKKPKRAHVCEHHQVFLNWS